MGDFKRLHADIIDGAHLIRINDMLIAGSDFPQTAFHGRPCFRRSENGDIKPSGQNTCPLDMVHMLMGNEQCIDIIACQFQFCQTFLDLLAADACIDQDFCVVRANICTVAAATAGDGAKFQPQDDHLFSLRRASMFSKPIKFLIIRL